MLYNFVLYFMATMLYQFGAIWAVDRLWEFVIKANEWKARYM